MPRKHSLTNIWKWLDFNLTEGFSQTYYVCNIYNKNLGYFFVFKHLFGQIFRSINFHKIFVSDDHRLFLAALRLWDTQIHGGHWSFIFIPFLFIQRLKFFRMYLMW